MTQTERVGLTLAAMIAFAVPARAQVTEYYHLDGIGSVRVVTDQAQVVVERHDLLPFGEEWCGSAVCASDAQAGGQARKFTGKERDTETDLDYFGARYYGSRLARFTSVDPLYSWVENLIDPQRWNRYAYGRGNPLRYVDPDGRALRTTTPDTVKAIAGDAAGRVTVSATGVVDSSGLTAEDLSHNEGALLLNQLASSPNVYTYGEGTTIQTLAGPRPVNGNSNLDNRYDARFDYRHGRPPSQAPPPGVDASIVIDQSVHHLAAGKPVSPAAKSFHELAEAYGRLDGGQSYQDAHDDAAARERTLVGQRPGFTDGLAGSTLTRVPEKKH